MRMRTCSTIVAVLVFCISGVLWAQATGDVSKGSIAVTVLDPSGAVVPGAKVTITGQAGSQTAATDGRGQAFFFNLIPSAYTVRVEQSGFRTYQAGNVVVSPSRQTQMNASLEPGIVTETVQVTERAAVVDTTSTTSQSSITSDMIRNMPVQRNLTSLFMLAPGAAPGGQTDNPNTPTGSFNPSISGASGLENQYIIDGVNATDQGFGAFGTWSSEYGSLGTGVNFDFVKEVQVKSSGFEAQYGQALGGIINVVTDSGGNVVHGSVYAYGAPEWAEGSYRQPNASGRISDPLDELHGRHSYDVGFNVGGPFLKNRFFWYGSFNPTFATLHRLAPPNFGARAFGFQDWKTRSWNWVGKLNFDISQNHHLEGTAFGDPSNSPTTVHRFLERDDLNSASSMDYGTRDWAVKYNGLFGAATILNASFAWNHSDFHEFPTTNLFSIKDYGKPKPNSAYTWEGGLDFTENTAGDNRQVNGMITHNTNLLGTHTFDLGYGYNNINYDATDFYSGPDWPLPSATGIDPADVGKMTHGGRFYLYPTRTVGGVDVQNVYRLNRGWFSNSAIASRTRYHFAFGQDTWQINRFITAKLGVRWEEQKLRGEANNYTFSGNWAPRLGFVIDPTGRRHTKVYAFWGRFFEKIPNDLAIRSMSIQASYMNGYFFSLPPSQANLVPGSVFSPSGVSPTIIYGGTKSQYEDQITGGIEHEIAGTVLSARFVWSNLKRIIEDTSGITAEAALAGSNQVYVITNPSAKLDIFHNSIPCTSGPDCSALPDGTGYTLTSGDLGPDGLPDTFPDPRRVYKALELSAERRFAHNWSLLANYRLSKLFGDYEGLFRNDNAQADPNITSLFDFVYSPLLGDQFKVGPLPNDRRHSGNLFVSYLWRNFNLGLGWQAMTGTPLNKLLAHPVYGNAGEVPIGGRGAFGRTPFQNYLDSHVEYRMKLGGEKRVLRLASDMFNLINKKTTTLQDQNFQLDGGVPNQDWLKPMWVHRPFYARFSARFEF